MAQTKKTIPEKTRVLIILDCSNSMWDKWQSDSKIKVTQQVLLHFLDSIQNQPDMEVALRVFGHLNREAFGSRLEVPFEADNHYKLQSKIKTLVPNGGCTADSALTNALKDFPRNEKSRNIILVITDGLDDCQGSVCEVARQVQQSGSISQSFIIGIGNPDDFQQKLDCAGRFTFVPNEELFAETLHEVFYLSDQKSLVTLALTDSKHNLYETDVPVIFYDHLTHAVKASLPGEPRRVVYHAHPSNIIALTFVLPLSDEVFTRELWEMFPECPLVFPEGVGVAPWMVPGGRAIAEATGDLMKRYNIVVWAHHGVFCAGEDPDAAFGLMHTVEKSAEILMKVLAVPGGKKQTVAPEQLRRLSEECGVDLPERFLRDKPGQNP